MPTNFQITGIIKTQFQPLFQLDKKELSSIGAIKMIVDEHPGFPCRVSLMDAQIGEEVLLFPYDHHPTNSPYQAKGPIFIRKNASTATLQVNEIPTMLRHRLLSLRGYNQNGFMLDAKTIEGKVLEANIEALFSNENIRYIQVHNAGPGCYNCQIDRVG